MLSPVTVLIVEGSARVRARLAERLRASGVHVLEAADVRAGLRTAAASTPSAVVFDVHLEGGLVGLTQLRRAAPKASIVVLTNESNDVHRDECLRHGADAFLDKSRDFERALELVLDAARMTSSS